MSSIRPAAKSLGFFTIKQMPFGQDPYTPTALFCVCRQGVHYECNEISDWLNHNGLRNQKLRYFLLLS